MKPLVQQADIIYLSFNWSFYANIKGCLSVKPTCRKMSSSREIGALFEEVDSDHNGFITRKDLADYVEKNHLPPETVDVSEHHFFWSIRKY